MQDWTVSTSSIVSKNGQGDAQTEAPTERSKESASEAPDGATCQPMGRGHVSVTSQPEPEGPNSDVGNGAQNTVSSENDIRNGLEVSGSDGAGTSVKDGVPAVKGGVPAELQRTEPELSVGETTATESGSMVKPDAGRAAASEGVLTDEGGNPVAKEK